MATELTLNFIRVSSKGSWKLGRKTKLILGFILYYSDVVGKVDNEHNWGRATLLSALVQNRGHLVNCFPPQGINWA